MSNETNRCPPLSHSLASPGRRIATSTTPRPSSKICAPSPARPRPVSSSTQPPSLPPQPRRDGQQQYSKVSGSPIEHQTPGIQRHFWPVRGHASDAASVGVDHSPQPAHADAAQGDAAAAPQTAPSSCLCGLFRQSSALGACLSRLNPTPARAAQLGLEQLSCADAQLSCDALELVNVLAQQVLKELAPPSHHRRQPTQRCVILLVLLHVLSHVADARSQHRNLHLR
mmetsp:Transcript_50983/g.114652  ORF Transcript_50983/g.114652 Transcript_50983/m.114652 type:complete len:227 (-) Transcript_50983:388-1068(-)